MIEYQQILFDEQRLDPRNFLYASELNPFEVYRQLRAAVQHYEKVFQLLGGCRVAISPLSSKLMSLGALLVAYEPKSDHQALGLPTSKAKAMPSRANIQTRNSLGCGWREIVMFRSVRGLNPESQQPTAFGMGLLALDVVMTSRAQRYPRWFAGGTCGNVLAALSYLGWRTAPISRLGPDAAADRIIEDLQRWNVSTGLISRPADGSTPVIIHRIGTTKNGEPYHSFSWRCPACGSHLPGYKPVLASVAHQLAEQCDRTDVFFFDRVSRGVLLLAEHYKSRGAIGDV